MTSVTCRCGTQIEHVEGSGERRPRCPDCGREIQEDQAASGGRGLWAVMGRAGTPAAPADQPTEPAASTPEETDAEETDTENFAAAQPQEPTGKPESPADHPQQADSPDQTARPRGLWQLMQGSKAGGSAAGGQADNRAVENRADKEVSQRKAGPAVPPLPADRRRTEDADELLDRDEAEDPDEPVELESLQASRAAEKRPAEPSPPLLSGPKRAGIPAVPVGGTETGSKKEPPKSWLQRRGLLSLLLGLLALPLSVMSAMPEVWTKLPATAAGFMALAVGLIAWNSGSRREPRVVERSLAAGGMSLGLLAMFLGPLVFADLGRRMRTEAGTQETFEHLSQIGDGLVKYHDHRNSFPPGGVIARDAGGRDLPMHSWMTALLPWIGQQELSSSINPDLPWSHRENFEAMSQVVPAFLAGDQPAAPAGSGYGAAHFSGVGGEGVDDRRGMVQLGIFGRNSRVTREDVIDGLSTTLVAGEISTLIPPWGEPTNWRSIGKGLNRERTGFGNAAGTGALMLRADGSVRFYSTRTSPEVLRRLSTRNGGEHIASEHR